RELRAYFQSPIGFVVIGLFVFLSAIFFAATNLLGASSEYNGLLSTMAFIFLFLVPILTMRLVTEEKRQHTDQMLITSPLSVTAIVIGKYLAAVAVFLITLIVTVLFPIMMSFFSLLGLEWWKILGGYIGLFLLGSAFIAVGLFFSSLTESQIVAAVATYTALLVMWIIDAVAGMVPTGWFAGLVFLALAAAAVALLVWFTTRSILAAIVVAIVLGGAVAAVAVLQQSLLEGLIAKVLAWFSLLKRYEDFNLGILGLSPVVYYLSFSAAFVFLTVRMIDRKRWM
ncbi:MAG TPA: ABC transporter permease, partial [Desulfobacterales bacterium]|nr:ABC transporter permease [Desulfobacterales bacterium]